MMEEAPAIGIDLGTTYSCAAVLHNDQLKIIHGDDGDRIMASCVLFKDSGERVIGNSAKDQFIQKYNSCVFGVKRLIGRTYEEYDKLKETIFFPFEVKDKNDRPVICLDVNKKEQVFYPEEISCMVLEKLKERAQEILRAKVTKAVITVPAHFNGSQRQATRHAGQLAGLDVLRIINEPTAASLAYELDNKYFDKECYILVYDFGGGTFDVSVVKVFHRFLDVLATNGEPFLGGDDIDRRITEYFIKEFNKQNNGDLSTDKSAIRRLMQRAEKVKRELSNVLSVDIEMEYLLENKHLVTTLNKAKFERLCRDLFEKTLKCVENTLKEAEITKEQVDEVLLIGGTTRIPYIKDMIRKYFNKEPNASIHPDEAVAIGAARQAALCEKSSSELIKSLKLEDVCSLSLGIECRGGIMNVLIPRNTKIPTTCLQAFPLEAGQEAVRITIYEGERSMVSDNVKLGEMILRDLKSTSERVVVNVTFSLDEDGILNVIAEEENGSQKKEIEVSITKNQLSAEEMKDMLSKAKQYRKEDRKRKELATARVDLESFCYDIQKILEEVENVDENLKKNILEQCQEIDNWLEDNNDLNLEEIYLKKGEFYVFCKDLLDQIQ